MSQASSETNLELLLRSVEKAQRQGRSQAALQLLHALSQEYPSEPRVWALLAELSPDPAQQQAALARLQQVAPDHALLAASREPTVPPQEEVAEPLVIAPPPTRTPNRRWLQMVLMLLALGFGLWVGWNFLPRLSPTPNQPTVPALPTMPMQPSELAVLPTAPALSTATTQPTTIAITQSATVQPTAAPTSLPLLALGTLLESEAWSATLIRPEYAVAVDGPIGNLEPRGRFVFALIVLSNLAEQPRAIDPGFFQLIDEQGRSYPPLVEASVAYLELFGRGQRGDAALGEVIAPERGLVSVPLIFDVPANSRELRLVFGREQSAGWPISDAPLEAEPQFGP